jgi:L-aminopeptidase/D-esterase-like protein
LQQNRLMCQKGKQTYQQRQAEFRAAQSYQPAENADNGASHEGSSRAGQGSVALSFHGTCDVASHHFKP